MSRHLSTWILTGLLLLLGPACRPALATDRAAWVTQKLATADAGLAPAQRAEKYAAMAEGPFPFFRGSAALFWLDFGTSPQLRVFGGTAATRTWLVGDAHPQNFGAFANARGGIVYDLNDFDEAVLADYQLDVWRLATALVLTMRQNGGFSPTEEATVLDAFSQRYLDTLTACVGNDRELQTVVTADNSYGKLDEFLAHVAKKRSRQRLLDTYTQLAPTGPAAGRVLSPQVSADLQAVPAPLASAISAALPGYGQTLRGSLRYSPSYFAVKSVAQRLHAGLGSLGTPRYYVLIEGPTSSPDDDIILDIKGQGAPSAYRNLDPEARAATESASGQNPAQRVVLATRSLGLQADDFVGVLALSGAPYSVRERSPWKDTLDLANLSTVEKMRKLSEQWAAILAHAHARADADARPHGSPILVEFESEVTRRTLGKHPDFRTLVRTIALGNAAQVTDDYKAFLRAFPQAPSPSRPTP